MNSNQANESNLSCNKPEQDFSTKNRAVSVASYSSSASTAKRLSSYGLSSRMSRLATPRLLGTSHIDDEHSISNKQSVEQLVAEKTILVEESEAYKNELAHLKEQNDEFRLLLEWKDQLQKDSEARLLNLKQHNHHLVSRITLLQDALDSSRKSKKGDPPLASLEGDAISAYQTELAQKIQSNEQLEERLSHIQSDMQHEIDRLRESLAKQRSQNEEKDIQLLNVQSQRDTLDKKIEIVQLENEDLRKQMQQISSQLLSSEDSGKKLVQDLENTEKLLLKASTEYQQCKEKLTTSEAEAQTLSEELKRASLQKTRDERQLKDMQTTLDTAFTHLELARDESTAFKRENATLADEMAVLTAAVSKLDSQIAKLKLQNEQQATELESFLLAPGETDSQLMSRDGLKPYINKIKQLQAQNQWSVSVAQKYYRLYNDSVPKIHKDKCIYIQPQI